MARRPRTRNIYNQQIDGVYGVFGSGSGLQAFYLQSAISPSDLDRISLISDIRGSEKWPVRDLFQRDVDHKRVEQSLLPYLEAPDRIKFFNPLTLTVLPMEKDGYTVLNKMPQIVEKTIEEDGVHWRTLEREGFYRVQWVEKTEQDARLIWNDSFSKLVAIDGQHRLSALKRFLADTSVGSAREDFLSWRIPVVIVSFRAVEGREPPSVLEVVRSIFIYINTQAHQVNKSRQILLSDESMNSICTQELIEHSHANDLKPANRRSAETLPLLFYDWRGEEHDKSQVASPAAVKTVEEINDWFEEYILGEDFTDYQGTALGINPTNKLSGAFVQERLAYQDVGSARDHFGKVLLPAVAHLLQNFAPYRSYVHGLRVLERKYLEGAQAELASHAFTKLRFGSSNAPVSIQGDVEEVLLDIHGRIIGLKQEYLKPPMDDEIGMRGCVCAFGSLAFELGYPNWLEYSKWFTSALNELYGDQWLTYHDYRDVGRTIDRHHRGKLGRTDRFLRHISIDHNDTVANYRLSDVGKALGAYVKLLVGTYGVVEAKDWGGEWGVVKEQALEDLRGTLVRGYRKEWRPRLKEQYPDGGAQLTEAVRVRAEKEAKLHIRRFEKELEYVANRS